MPNYKLKKVSEFIRENYAEPLPCSQTIIRAINKGTIPGSRVGGLWYVHVDDSGNIARELNEFELEAFRLYKEWSDDAAA